MKVIGTIHPARILRGGWSHDPFALAAVKRFAQLLKDELEPIDVERPAPGLIVAKSLDDLHQWQAGITDSGVSMDIECAGHHLRGIGFCRVHDLVPIWVPIRHQGGSLAWGHTMMLAIVKWLDDLLGDASIPKITHNGLFDWCLLMQLGFRCAGWQYDTMYAAHVAWPEIPKALQYQATLHMGMPNWKRLVDEDEEEGEGK